MGASPPKEEIQMAKAATKYQGMEVTLTLTEAEAFTLRDILMLIGGSPDQSRRKHCDAIAVALDSQGIKGTNDEDIKPESVICFI